MSSYPMTTTRSSGCYIYMDHCWVVVLIAIGVVLAVLGSVLMGTAPSTQFVDGNTQFIFGFVFMMLFAIYIVNLMLWASLNDATCLCGVLVFANVVMVLTIIGSVLVGVAPSHSFAVTNSMFIAGFSFLIIMAVIVTIASIGAMIASCC